MDENTAVAKWPVTVIIIGAGIRGTAYANFNFPDKLKVVAVATPLKVEQERIRKLHDVPSDRIYQSWTDAAIESRMADCAFICTQDQMHREPAEVFARKGYHILLEKPMAVTEEDCKSIVKTCEESGILLAVCHVLRYFPPVVKMKELIDSGIIGDVVNIQHTENVGFWHFAHSFVRGNWRKRSESTFSLLSKCCHDVDLICYWMGGIKCQKVSSFGSLKHFKKSNQPNGAASFCLDCPLEPVCPYSAKKLYLHSFAPTPVWPLQIVCDIEDLRPVEYYEAVKEKLVDGPYGRCVYNCDNDVFDNQVVNFEFDNGSTATLTMIAFTKELCERTTKIWGTKGHLSWYGKGDGPIIHYDFLSQSEKKIPPDRLVPENSNCRGHEGADYFMVESFLTAIANRDASYIKTGPKESLSSHLIVFAAQGAQERNKVAVFAEDKMSWEYQ